MNMKEKNKMKRSSVRGGKIGIISLLIIGMLFSCAKDEEGTVNTVSSNGEVFERDTLSVSEINSRIDVIRQAKGEFNWSDATNQMIWSAIVHSENIVTIGYQGDLSGATNKGTSEDQEIKTRLKKLVLNSEMKGIASKKAEEDKLFLGENDTIKFIDVFIHNRETFVNLLKEKNIRYIEPSNYAYELEQKNTMKSASSIGCGGSPETLTAGDYTVVAPNAKVPWNFYIHNIPQAWEYSTGAGVTIAVVDTGIADQQSLMGSDFNNGLSQGRTIEKYSTYVDSFWPWATTVTSPNDACGHGTTMNAMAAAPRNNKGFPVGVAYNANLISYKASSGVYIGFYQASRGVEKAFMKLADNNKVKIISMSMGTEGIIPQTKIRDAIKYAYSKNKLIFSAAGTSVQVINNFYGVIFPATMDEVVAVTGIQEGTEFKRCDNCHSGKEVDFTVVMQRKATKKTVPVLGAANNTEEYVGGSSVATATMAGVAALVWSKNPTWTRQQVLDKLQRSASLYPSKDAQFGYGNVDVLKAVQ